MKPGIIYLVRVTGAQLDYGDKGGGKFSDKNHAIARAKQVKRRYPEATVEIYETPTEWTTLEHW